ncbi:glycosyltransferase [Eubacterium sp.]|uniref:glycosyltransferase n=1 Tax=Eubacterium sp. TaxID=142586 RepID=UPI00351FF954
MKKKIFFITNGLSGGGAERVMSILANYLDDNGYEVSFIMLKNYPEAYKLNLTISKYYKNNTKRRDFIGNFMYIRSFMQKENNAVFISFFTRQNLYTIMAAIGTNNRVVISERNNPEITVNGKIEEIVRKILYKSSKCKYIVFQTQGAKEYFDKEIQNKGTIILNPLNNKLPICDKMHSKKKIVAIGRLNSQKNYPLMLKAFKRFCKIYNDYTLHIYGKGESKDSLKQLTFELEINDKVIFEGFKENIHKEIQDATMFVISSDYEGLSNALLEAMGMGLPCISTDSPPGGARMVINNNENGILVPVGDEIKLYKAMLKIASDKKFANYIATNALKIRKNLSIDRICKEWIKILEKCFDKK